MTQAGADLIVAHFGTTVGGSIGANTTPSLEDCATRLDQWAAAAMEVRKGDHRHLPRRTDCHARRRGVYV